MSSVMPSISTIKESLPHSFQNVIISSNEETKVVVLRSNVTDVEGIKKWIEDFSERTCTSYKLQKTKTESYKLKCRRIYLCHHSAHRKPDPIDNKRGKSKNYHCKAMINVVIKHDTKKTRRTDKFIKDGLLAVITVQYDHSHSVNTREAYSSLRPVNELKETFSQYFDLGSNVAETMKEHEKKLSTEHSIQPNSLEMANAQVNPKYRTAKYWYENWRLENFGPKSGTAAIEKLRSKIPEYEKEGCQILISENPLAIAIITPLMRRAHALSSSKDISFADSTASCDLSSHVVTLLLTPCAAGAVPLGVVISGGQSQIDYTTGFQLLKTGLGNNSFNNQHYPAIIMTDDSEAERNALRTVWPMSELLLCRFHVCQAVWRWLSTEKNNVPSSLRPVFYQDFNQILTSLTNSEANINYNSAVISGKFHATWLEYLNSYWMRKEAWCLAYRDEKTRGHQTNNFSEISVRLLKDETLNRFKTYNIVTLVDKICRDMQDYYIGRLTKFANSRDDRARLQFEKEKRKASYLKQDDIKLFGDLFLVPSEKDRSTTYTVDPAAGFCSCPIGRKGSYCKHAAGVHMFYGINVFVGNLPPITAENRHQMAVLAFGNDAGPISEYLPLDLESNSHPISHLTEERHEVVTPASIDKPFAVTENRQLKEDPMKWLTLGLGILAEKFEAYGSACSEKIAKRFVSVCRGISTSNGIESFICKSGKFSSHRTNSRIKVQTTSTARRKTIRKARKITKK